MNMQILTANSLYDVYPTLPVIRKANFSKPEVVGYEINGTPITQSLLEQQLQEAILQVENGNFITDEDLDTEIQLW
jgi:hypothetical protein